MVNIDNFTATPYDSGVLLQWTAGFGTVTSPATAKCKVTIQYSNSPFDYSLPNNAPYVVRDLGQLQGQQNQVYHKNLQNSLPYYYSLFIYYEDSGFWHGPFLSTPQWAVPVSGSQSLFSSGSLSYSKLEVNTRVSPLHDSVISVIVWLPYDQQNREATITQDINSIKPAHSKVHVLFERFYVSHTTSTQFGQMDLDTSVFEIINGTIINKVPTIDASHSGETSIEVS